MPSPLGAAATITPAVVDQSIVRAVERVCGTLLCRKVVLVQSTFEAATCRLGDQPHVLGCVGFAGAINGLVYFCLPMAFAQLAAAHVLDMTPAQVEMEGLEVIKDAVGEITNMTVGGFKNALADLGFPSKLTVPTIVTGHQLSIASIKSATRHIFDFDCEGHRLVADVQLKIE